MANERYCKCCEKLYYYCPSCKRYVDKPQWMILFDQESCKELFNMVSAYNMNRATKEDIKSVLDKYEITDYSEYKDSIKNLLNELFPPYVPKKKKRKVDVVYNNEEATLSEDSLSEGML